MPFSKTRKHLENGKTWFDLEKDQTIEKIPDYEQIKKIVVADCDGIITDGKSICTKTGKFAKNYGAYDKEAIEFMVHLGWKFIFVSSDKAGLEITLNRLEHLEKIDQEKISYEYADSNARCAIVSKLLESDNKVLFVGDSLSDIESLNIATWAATTKNAPNVVKEYCDYIAENEGGNGGFAEILFAIHNDIVENGFKS